MTWIKLDDKVPSHPKIGGLSDKAFRWWINSICYASEYLTDGALPRVFCRRVPNKIRTELINAKLWRFADPHLEICGYLEHQQSREVVEKERRRNRDRRNTERGTPDRRTAGTTAGATGGSATEKPRPEVEGEVDTEKKSAATRPSTPLTLTKKRNGFAEFEHPRFDVPTWWHLENVKGLSGGESRMMQFYRWLAARVERTNEDTLPRKEWLNRCFGDWLAESRVTASSVPSPADTARMIAERMAKAGK